MSLDLNPAINPATTSPTPPQPLTLRTIDLRRAVFASLLDTTRPLRLDDIVTELEINQHVDVVGHLRVSPRQRIADLLWWEIERGHVEHVAPGAYRLIEESLSPSVRWRCVHWRELVGRREE